LQGTASFATSASWAPAGGTNTMVQFNESGSFSGIGGVTINKIARSFQNGNNAIATGSYSHAQGINTIASGSYSHAEGINNTAIGDSSHTEGRSTTTIGEYSHAEGNGGIANGIGSHAEGISSVTGIAAYSSSITSGVVEIDASAGDLTGTFSDGVVIYYADASNPGGNIITGIVTGSLWNGTNTIFQLLNDASTIAPAGILDPSGNLPISIGGYGAHAEGQSSVAIGDSSHAEGNSITYVEYSHAEGNATTYGAYSHAEGNGNTYGYASHAEGAAIAFADYSHAEGSGTAGYKAYTTVNIAAGVITFPAYYGNLTAIFAPTTIIYVEDQNQSTILIHEVSSSLFNGTETEVTLVDSAYDPQSGYLVGIVGNAQPTYADASIGGTSHAEGRDTITLGSYSHAEGNRTTTHGYYQTVVGQYNAPVQVSSSFVIGNGVDGSTPSNLLVAYGNEVQITGSLTVSGSSTFQNIGLAQFTGSVIAQAVTGSFTGSFVGDGSGLTGVGATEYIRRSDYTSSLDPNVNYLYAGYAPVGSAEAASIWTISRLSISSSGATLTQTTSSAAWTNRYSYTYL
jgi:hypothetical protein